MRSGGIFTIKHRVPTAHLMLCWALGAQRWHHTIPVLTRFSDHQHTMGSQCGTQRGTPDLLLDQDKVWLGGFHSRRDS